jgi:hypothetical protein
MNFEIILFYSAVDPANMFEALSTRANRHQQLHKYSTLFGSRFQPQTQCKVE